MGAHRLGLHELLHVRKATVPDAGQAQLYQQLGIDWKSEFTPIKYYVKD